MNVADSFLIGLAFALGAGAGCGVIVAVVWSGNWVRNLALRYAQAGWYKDEVPEGPAYRRRKAAWALRYLLDNGATL